MSRQKYPTISHELFLALQKLANRIKNWRALKQMSQEDLALKSGLKRAYIGHIEQAKINTGVGNLIKIAKALDITLVELIVDIDKTN